MKENAASTRNIFGISGSLRENSFNSHILQIIARLLPEHVHLTMFGQLHQIPPFNPDAEEDEAVKSFKNAVKSADGIIICTPEYAFGVPGVLKNALDWTVSTGEFNGKPVSAISASPLNSGGDKALASLLLTLTALGVRKNEDSFLSVPNIKQKITFEGSLNNSDLLKDLQAQADNLLKIIHTSA